MTEVILTNIICLEQLKLRSNKLAAVFFILTYNPGTDLQSHSGYVPLKV